MIRNYSCLILLAEVLAYFANGDYNALDTNPNLSNDNLRKKYGKSNRNLNSNVITMSIIETVSGKGPDKKSIKELVENFTNGLGGIDNGSDPSQRDGYRRIRWDNNNIPWKIPGAYFALSRGIVFSNDDNKFRVSNSSDKDDDKFDSINKEASKHFQTYSTERLFAPLEDNTVTFQFYLPGTDEKAIISAFGAVFVDVWLPNKTKMRFYDKLGNLIRELAVEEYSTGLSFLGVNFGMPLISKVEVVLGTSTLDNYSVQDDVVVLDDLYYSEPLRSDLFP